MLELLLNLFFADLHQIDSKPPRLHFEKTLIEDVSPPPLEISRKEIPYPRAESVIVANINTGEIIYSKNPERIMPIASLTKIMTAILTLEEKDTEELVRVDTTNVQGVKMWLYKDEIISVRNLLYGLLIKSANDAAVNLAIEISGSEERFVKKMNQKAKDLGLKNTYFVNSSGLDSDLGSNVSSVKDLLNLSKYALKKPLFKKITSTKKATVYSANGKIEHNLNSTNILLGGNFNGVKTGFTDRAGQCLILLSGDTISIVLNSPDRFGESKNIFEII